MASPCIIFKMFMNVLPTKSDKYITILYQRRVHEKSDPIFTNTSKFHTSVYPFF